MNYMNIYLFKNKKFYHLIDVIEFMKYEKINTDEYGLIRKIEKNYIKYKVVKLDSEEFRSSKIGRLHLGDEFYNLIRGIYTEEPISIDTTTISDWINTNRFIF